MANTEQKTRFSIVKALCRSVLADPTEAQLHQIRRLIESYKENDESREAAALLEMLEGSSSKASSFAPSKLVRSRSSLLGEDLSPRTPLPVDKETAVPLAEIAFPAGSSAMRPSFDPILEGAIISLIEEWSYWDALIAQGIQPTRSCLIYGAPGTGKTRLACWIGEQLGLPVVVARLDGLISSFLGTTSRNIGALFNFANRYRCVLLLDEFDAIAKVRDDPHEVGEIKRVVNTLLQNLDGRRDIGITIGVTNHEKLLDPAIWRRFDAQLEIPKPKFETRVVIAQRYLDQMLDCDRNARVLAWLSDDLAGSEIESLARSIRKAMAIESENFDFIQTLKKLSTLNSGRLSMRRIASLHLDNQALASAMYADPELRLEKAELAALFARNPSTISRWINEPNQKR